MQAIRAGLKALQGLGVWGVTVNVWWSQVEPSPRQYDWAQYQAVFDAARELGLRVKVGREACMHVDASCSLQGPAAGGEDRAALSILQCWASITAVL